MPDDTIRPASEDPLGDPADQQGFGGNIRPASEDPMGDPADQQGAYPGVLPASQDPYGDPADIQNAMNQHLANTDPTYTQQQVANQLGGMSSGQADDLAGSLINLAQQQGVDVRGLASQFGIDLNQAGQFLPQLIGLLHQNHPNELAQAASREPGLAGLIANPTVGGILGALASRFFGGR
jgi:hypothetical protein